MANQDPPQRQPRGVHSVDHFALNVPSIDVARGFYAAFGLDVRDAQQPGGAELELRAQDGHCWGRVLPGERKSLAYLSFGCFEDDLDPLKAQIAAAGAVLERGDEGHDTWFRDPDGNVIQVVAGPKPTPDSKPAPAATGVGANRRGASCRSEAAPVKPRRMSHVLLFTPDVGRAVRFYRAAIGLRLSDRSGDIIAFMHAPHGSDHHILAFAKSSAKGWHHVAWDVASIDEVGRGAAQMAAAGYAEGWGTGRHVLGSNYFHYVRDPWGSFSEYSADIDFIEAGRPWSSGDFPPEDSLYLWGPDVPPYFIHNSEA